MARMQDERLDLEFQAQCALVEWAKRRAAEVPVLSFFFHVPNGGWRDPRTAKALVKAGVKAGVPDLLLLARRHHGGITYSGMAIEMKSPTGTLTVEQRRWLAELSRQGFLAEMHRDWVRAAERLWWYVGGRGPALPQ
jgi:hypothetical protein